jgi:hypothetical protein
MTAQRNGKRRFFERVITRDAKVPLSADDPEMENGWRCRSDLDDMEGGK